MPVLSPPVDDLAELVLGTLEEPWPTTDDDRRSFHRRLGLQEEDVAGNTDDDQTSMSNLATSLPGVTGVDTMFRGEFLGLSLFAYTQHHDDGAESRTAYPLLRHILSDRLGSPAEEWGPSNEPACFWLSGALQLEMYCFQRRLSGIMLGPSHVARSAAHDREAVERQRRSDPRDDQ